MAERPAANTDAMISMATEGQNLAEGGQDEAVLRERRRLQTLREYRILDTGPEPAFDRVTKLVADLFDVPIALVSLVDDCRQWFKSAYGLEVSETARDISFCQFVIVEELAMVVTDVLGDPRFLDNPLVTGDPFIRFYAGVPLRAYNGDVLGTLCIIDRKERSTLSSRELERLEDFGAIMMAEAELRRTAMERDDARRMLDRALDYSSIAIWQFDARAETLAWSGAVTELWGSDPDGDLRSLDKALDRVHPDDRAHVRATLGQAVADGRPYAVEHRILHPDRGVRWLSVRGDWDDWADDAKLIGICIDITEQKSRQENANLLMRELHHRMRNLFATVSAIISLTRHSARDVDDYVERIGYRLDALNRAQNVLLGANFMTGSMHALLSEVEAAFPRIDWSGPDLLLPENALVAMALLFNELATNAAKHGALTGQNGRVTVSWTQDPEGSEPRLFRLTWAETGGAISVVPPERTSFGTLLMERSVRNNLGGTIERRWESTGLIVDIALPARWRDA